MIIKEVISQLRTFHPQTPCAFDLWVPDDVKQEAREAGYPDITDEEVATVLERVHAKQDATIGINWDVLRSWIGEVCDREPQFVEEEE